MLILQSHLNAVYSRPTLWIHGLFWPKQSSLTEMNKDGFDAFLSMICEVKFCFCQWWLSDLFLVEDHFHNVLRITQTNSFSGWPVTATVYFNQSRTTDKDDFTEFYFVFIGDLPGRFFVSGRLKRLFCLLHWMSCIKALRKDFYLYQSIFTLWYFKLLLE